MGNIIPKEVNKTGIQMSNTGFLERQDYIQTKTDYMKQWKVIKDR